MDGKISPDLAVVFALGAAVGGSDLLRLLFVASPGQSAILDMANCVFLVAVVAAFALGHLLLWRRIRTAGRAARPHAVAAAERLTKMAWAAALLAALLGTALLLLNLPGGGGGGGACAAA